MQNVVINHGTPDMRSAQFFTQMLGMDLAVELSVPPGLSASEAEIFVTEALNKAVETVPQLKFHVVIGRSDH